MADEIPSSTSARSRWWLATSGLGGRTLIWIAILVLIVAAADRLKLVIDCSADHRFTISPSLTRILKAQNEPIEIVGIWKADEEARFSVISADLTLMTARHHQITWHRIDAELDKPELDRFAERYHERAEQTLYVCRGQRTFAIPLSEGTRLVLQREIGGALVTLADPHPPQAVFMQGHGELRPNGGLDDGCEVFAHALELAGYRVALLEPGQATAIPPEAVLILAGPTANFSTEDLERIQQHLVDGGGVLVLGDDRCPVDVCATLRMKGVLIANGFPIDRTRLLDPHAPTQPAQVVYSMHHHFESHAGAFPHPNLLLDESMINPTHPATAPTQHTGTRVLSPETASVEVFGADLVARIDAAAAKFFSVQGPQNSVVLLTTAPGDAWTQPFKPSIEAPSGIEHADARALAWAIEYPADPHSVRSDVGGRAVVWGSRQGASNRVLVQLAFANANVLRDMCDWLSRRSSATDIPEAEFAAFQVSASDRLMTMLLGALVVVLPCLFLGGAMIAWWERR